MSDKITYKDAGVDVERGYEAVELIKKHVASTTNNSVLGGLGGFGGLYSLENENIARPVLVSGTDGVGTKLKYAFLLDKHDTIGIDCVAMCVNDIVCQGAKPLFFLDYIASSMIQPKKIEQIVSGVAEGCRQAGCALIGGETAELAGMYADNEYDLVGFSVGVVDKDKIIDGSKVRNGDAIIGITSSGIHSNGYTLVRKLLGENADELNKHSDELGRTFAEEVMQPTKIYVKIVEEIKAKNHRIKGIAHITGGGFVENIPRIIPEGLCAKINLNSYQVPPIFNILQRLSGLDDSQIYNTFNMGIGLIVIVDNSSADSVLNTLKLIGERATIIGEIVKGQQKIQLVR